MNDDCKKVVAHINKLQGQLNAFKKYFEEGRKCGETMHLAVSTVKSFDSLKAKIVQGFVTQELLKGKPLSPADKEILEKLISLIKA